MTRTDKLYATLDDLERKFSAILLAEFERLASGNSSRFFDCKIPHLFDGRFWQNADVARIEKMEKDIVAIREKLGEPLDVGPVALAAEFVEAYASLPNKHDGGKKCLAKKMIERLKTEQ